MRFTLDGFVWLIVIQLNCIRIRIVFRMRLFSYASDQSVYQQQLYRQRGDVTYDMYPDRSRLVAPPADATQRPHMDYTDSVPYQPERAEPVSPYFPRKSGTLPRDRDRYVREYIPDVTDAAAAPRHTPPSHRHPMTHQHAHADRSSTYYDTQPAAYSQPMTSQYGFNQLEPSDEAYVYDQPMGAIPAYRTDRPEQKPKRDHHRMLGIPPPVPVAHAPLSPTQQQRMVHSNAR